MLSIERLWPLKYANLLSAKRLFFFRIFLKIKAALTPIVKINANLPQQKPLMTRTHSPVKEKKNNTLLRITKQLL